MVSEDMREARDKLIVALDVPSVKEACAVVESLGDTVTFYKIGAELIYHGGLDLAKKLKKDGKKIFIDAKLHDIPRTVLAAARNIETYQADILTLHCNSSNYEALKQYRQENENSQMQWCFVTVLTSENDVDFKKLKIRRSVDFHVKKLAEEAISAGADGIVASAQEAMSLRNNGLRGKKFIIITPGIRPEGSPNHDQKRITTPAEAIKSGSDYLVVGRPILESVNQKEMAEEIVKEIHDAVVANRGQSITISAISKNNGTTTLQYPAQYPETQFAVNNA